MHIGTIQCSILPIKIMSNLSNKEYERFFLSEYHDEHLVTSYLVLSSQSTSVWERHGIANVAVQYL